MAEAAGYCSNCCCRLMIWILGIILSIIVLVGFAVALFFNIVNPQKMKVQVNDAWISKFNFTQQNQTHFLHYDMEFNVTLRNPNRIMSFFYDDFVVGAYYQSDEKTLKNYVDSHCMEFYQGKKNTTLLRFRFKGKREVYLLESNERTKYVEQFEKEKRAGIFYIDWKVEFRTRVKLGAIRIGVFQPKLRCGSSQVPFYGNGKSVNDTTSNVAKCGVKFKATSIFEPLD